jgi:hypothetical protein
MFELLSCPDKLLLLFVEILLPFVYSAADVLFHGNACFLSQSATACTSRPPLHRLENYPPPLRHYYVSRLHQLCKGQKKESGFVLGRPGLTPEPSNSRFLVGRPVAPAQRIPRLARYTCSRELRPSCNSTESRQLVFARTQRLSIEV